MSCALLGEPIDIHGGGMDLQFPAPRERDRAERRRHRRPFVNVWMHNGFLNVDNEKMSKSLGNFFTIRDVLKRFDGETVRFFMLRTHYRSPFNFSDQPRGRAQRAARLYTALRRRGRRAGLADVDWAQPQAAAFRAAMDDDFNTPGAVPCCSTWPARSTAARPADAALLKALGGTLGICSRSPAPTCRAAAAWTKRPSRRASPPARRPRRRATSPGRPHPRELAAQGIVLKDSPQGTTWVKA
jgi:cysteinyl-tRNA synthetase